MPAPVPCAHSLRPFSAPILCVRTVGVRAVGRSGSHVRPGLRLPNRGWAAPGFPKKSDVEYQQELMDVCSTCHVGWSRCNTNAPGSSVEARCAGR